MKPNIHPDYHTITLVMTDGTKLQTRSTYGKEGDKLQLDVDPTTHPAWTKGAARVDNKNTSIAKFNSKFGNLGFGGAAESKKEDKKDDK